MAINLYKNNNVWYVEDDVKNITVHGFTEEEALTNWEQTIRDLENFS